MPNLTIQLTEGKAVTLEQIADHYNISVETLIQGIIDEYIVRFREGETSTEKVNYKDIQDEG